MNQEQLKTCLQRDKTFLKELFESDSVVKSKRILNFVELLRKSGICAIKSGVRSHVPPGTKRVPPRLSTKELYEITKTTSLDWALIQSITSGSRSHENRSSNK